MYTKACCDGVLGKHFPFENYSIQMKKYRDQALREAIVASLPSVWRFAVSLAGSLDLADDLSQKTCVRALERKDQIYDVTGVKRWLMTICRSIWYNDLRAKALRQTQSLDASAGLDVAADLLPAETNIYAREVFTSISALPETHRSVVVLALVEGYTYRETAIILDIPIGTVMSRLSSARGKLAKDFSDETKAEKKEGGK